MRRAAALVALVSLLFGGVAMAQENAAKARLDDFAAPTASSEIEIGQVAPATRATAVEQKRDRSVETPRPEKPVVQSWDQQAGTTDRALTVQVARHTDRGAQATAPLSTRSDGLPTAAERLGGTDRCDPQERTSQQGSGCRRILELRAGEFSATETPRLSAEQELLARQFSAMADAEGRASQELGFIVLPRPRTEVNSVEDENGDVAMGEALKGVLLQIGVQP
jgi:hypothetical protein